MMEFEHRGYKVTYSDNDDTWSCGLLELYGMASPQAAKRKIERTVSAMKKADPGNHQLPTFIVSSHNGLTAATIVGKAFMSRGDSNEGQAWVSIDGAKGRSKRAILDMVDLSHPDATEKMDAYRASLVAEKKAGLARVAAGKAIPRLTRAAIDLPETD